MGLRRSPNPTSDTRQDQAINSVYSHVAQDAGNATATLDFIGAPELVLQIDSGGSMLFPRIVIKPYSCIGVRRALHLCEKSSL